MNTRPTRPGRGIAARFGAAGSRVLGRHASWLPAAGLLLACGCASMPESAGERLMTWAEIRAWAGLGADTDESAERATVQSWFGDLVDGLHARSIEQIAAYAVEARQIAAWAAQYDLLAPYASWLEARVDYYAAAQAAMDRVPVTTPAAKPPPRPPKPILLPKPPPRGTITVRGAKTQPVLPPPRPRHQPPRVVVPPPTIESRRAQAAADADYWRRQVANRRPSARAAALTPRLEAIFRAEQVPECLVWVAEVESGFNPEARSPAGAAGLFQLMPATARSLGLSTHRPDARLDPEANARAAAAYFRQLYRRFNSWPLVFAAYNAGEGRVATALKRTGKQDYAAIAERLPLETRMYVPRVQETIRLRAGIAPEAMPVAL